MLKFSNQTAWFTSDWHWNHINLCRGISKWTGKAGYRDFDTLEDMRAAIRDNANLRNWLAFLTLRQDPKAQWEIRQYADALNTMLVEKFPRTMELFNATNNV